MPWVSRHSPSRIAPAKRRAVRDTQRDPYEERIRQAMKHPCFTKRRHRGELAQALVPHLGHRVKEESHEAESVRLWLPRGAC